MKSFFFLWVLLSGLSVPRSFCQKNCDTLVTKDGRRIAAEIISSNNEEITFTKCDEFSGLG